MKRNNKLLWNSFFTCIVLLVIAGLSGCATSSNNTYTPPPAPVKETPVRKPAYQSEPGTRKYALCEISPIGSLKNETAIRSSAIIRGDCNQYRKATGVVVGFWCNNPECRPANTQDISQVPGKITGEAVDGKITGHVILVSRLGVFYGLMNQKGEYDSGYLKVNGNLAFLGKFNPDGSFRQGTKILRTKSGVEVIHADNYINNNPDGYTHKLLDQKLQLFHCSYAGTCQLYVRSKVDEQVSAVLGVIQQSLLEDMLLAPPAFKALGLLVKSAEAMKSLIAAHKIYGRVSDSAEIGGILLQ
ncbi:hypothetical protein [Undibacterium pigrum]|uniref:Lipoprotein n=1 Tax=Undibacterium pigrum TaxID=401470 RepID=A0A318J3U5_9BURK|nr:hypothetical protein [Undibacterium pigrum]PXX41351.1 hypothetical protein DFR42_1072 [Undibacterium pigrum]